MDIPQRSSSVSSIKKIKKLSKGKLSRQDGAHKRKFPEEWKGAQIFEKKQACVQEDKENQPNSGTLKKKKMKKQHEGCRVPLSPRPVEDNRSKSAAAAMSKIATMNARASIEQKKVKHVDRRSSLGCIPSPPAKAAEPETEPPTIEDNSPLAVQNIRRCSSALSESTTTDSVEMRLQLSNRMALEAEKLDLEAQVEAERASVAAKEMALKTQKDEEEQRARELQQTLNDLAKQVKEMKESKEQQARELERHFSQTAKVQTEVQKCKSSSEELKRQVELLQEEVKTYKAEKSEAEKELEHQKQINRRLSQRLSGRFAMEELTADEDLQELLQEIETPHTEKHIAKHHVPHANDGSPLQNAPWRLLDPQTPKASSTSSLARSATQTKSDDNGERYNSFMKVPSVTPSKDRAPVIYNEPRNKVKQQEYAVHLEQQIAERKEMKKQQNEMDKAVTMNYFPFGRPGSGAPVRDENSNVVANVTFSRSRRPVPVDHPAGPLYAQRSHSQEVFCARKKS